MQDSVIMLITRLNDKARDKFILLWRNDYNIETDCAKNKMAPVTCVVVRSIIPINYAMAFLDLRQGWGLTRVKLV